MSRYLEQLSSNDLVKKGRLTVMQSNGGAISSKSASREPVRTLFSGPAGGVVGAFEIAQQAGYRKVLTFDMGGTSTDVCLCDGGIETTNESSIDHHPISIQSIGIHTVGAGGEPGPICYGRGSDVTVTDANLFLGRLDPDYFLGGEFQLHPEKIQPLLERMGKDLAKSSNRKWEPVEIAEGIVKIVNSQMERALRVISLERGHDTRDYTLVTFGGAGALHACGLAEALMIPRIVVPRNPGTLSAMGILRADIVQDASVTSVVTTKDPNYMATLEQDFAKLEKEVRQKLKKEEFSSSEIILEKGVDTRYLGQSYEINTPFAKDVEELFHNRHERAYGYANRSLPVEFVNLRVRGFIKLPLPPLPESRLKSAEPSLEALVQEKHVTIDGKTTPVKFYLRDKLEAGNHLSGPAIILEYSATTFVPPTFSAHVDGWHNLIIERTSD
jgi:N-methylhydantoinase A